MKIIHNSTILTHDQLQAMKFVRSPEVQAEYDSIPVEDRERLFLEDISKNGFYRNEDFTVIKNKYPYMMNNRPHYIIICENGWSLLPAYVRLTRDVIKFFNFQLIFENEQKDKSIKKIKHYHAF